MDLTRKLLTTKIEATTAKMLMGYFFRCYSPAVVLLDSFGDMSWVEASAEVTTCLPQVSDDTQSVDSVNEIMIPNSSILLSFLSTIV